MFTSTSQTTLTGNPFRPYEDRTFADVRFDARQFHARPSLTESARSMLKHWPSRQRSQVIRRSA